MAAEYWGNCQICGKEHKVSGQTIAKHGYTLRNGWQEGACYGSQHKPIQISCDMIEGGIEAAKRYIEKSTEEIDRLRVSPLDGAGRVWALFRKHTRSGERISMHQVTIAANARGEIEIMEEWNNKVLKTHDPRTSSLKTVEAVARDLADKRIAYLAHTIEESRESIDYLTERLKNWKPTPLRPITAQDKAAAAPKVHFKASKYGYKNTSLCSGSAMGAQRNAGSRTTENRHEVTCAACLKALKERDELPAKRATEKEKERLADIRWYEREIKETQKQLRKFADDPVATINLTQSLTAYTAKLEELKAAAPKE